MVSNGNVTGVVSRLIEDGLVTRTVDQEDRRSATVRLTRKGREAFSAMAAAHERWMDEMFADLSGGQMRRVDAAAHASAPLDRGASGLSRIGGSREFAQRRVELAAVLVGERRRPQPAHPRLDAGAGLGAIDEAHDGREAGQSPLVGIAVPLDEALAFGNFHREVIIGRARPDAREPGIDPNLLDLVAQRAAAPSAQSGHRVQREEAGQSGRVDAAPAPE